MKLLTMALVIAMVAVTVWLSAPGVDKAEAAGSDAVACPSGAAHILNLTARSDTRFRVVSARWQNVSYAASYRTEATELKNGALRGRTKTTASAGWMGGGMRGANIFRIYGEQHKVRVLALNRSGAIVACAVITTGG